MSLSHVDVELHHVEDPSEPLPGTTPTEAGVAPTIDLTEAADQAPSGRPQFTITEAAAACGVSRKTITRKLTDLAGHGAAKDDDGVWRIPVEALLAVGLHPGRSLPERPRPTQMAPSSASGAGAAAAATTRGSLLASEVRPVGDGAAADLVTVRRDRWDDLRIRLARAEAEAAERALALADARLALRALTAGPTSGSRPASEAARSVHEDRPGAGGFALAAAPFPATPPAGPATPRADELSSGARAGSAPAPAGAATGPATATGAPANAALPNAAPAEPGSAVDPVVLARAQAAQSGGYVPAGAAAARKRRWWQSK